MYSIRTADFSLEFTPGVDAILIKVYCDDFSGITSFDATDSYIELAAQRFGHILIKGSLINNRRGHTQQLAFEYDVDQTYLQNFVAELVADYSKYVE